MQAIIVTGTPGTGKTSLAKELSLLLDYTYLDGAKFINNQHLSEGFDKKRRSQIIDPQKLKKALIRLLNASKKPTIIDSHLAHFLPPKYVKACIMTRCDLKTLKRRLENKGYPAKKVRENLDAEIFEICFQEAKEAGHKPFLIDTTKISPKAAAKKIISSKKLKKFEKNA